MNIENTLKMNLVKIKTNKKSLVITSITNLDFESFEVVDNSLLEEIEVEPLTPLLVFNTKKQIQEKVNISTIEVDNHWLVKNDILHKIIHIL